MNNARNIQSTFDLTSFKNLNAPKFEAYSIGNLLFPRGEELFDRTFYALIEGKIYGVKVLAWAIGGTSVSPKKMYLIQTPTFTRWTNLAESPLFTSVNDLIEGRNKVEIPLIWDYNLFANVPSSLRLINRGYSDNRCWEVRQSFYYCQNDGKVNETNTKIAYLVGTPQGIFFGLEQKDYCRNTKEECLSAKFNGIDIVDFAEPIVVEIKIEIPRTEPVMRKLVLE